MPMIGSISWGLQDGKLNGRAAPGPSVTSTAGRRLVSDPGLWFALITMAAAATVDLAYGREASLAVTLVFGPFVASALSPARLTAGVGLLATAASFALGWPDGSAGTAPQIVRAAAVAIGSILAVRLAAERTRREAKLVSVSRVADTAQRAILRPLPARLGPYRLTARYVSASADAKIGGDFFDAVDGPFGSRLLVGDVRGKGLDAVRLTAILLGEFRSRAVSEPRLSDVVSFADQAVERASSEGEDFATAIFIEDRDGALTVIRCGHPLPLCTEPRGGVTTLEVPGTVPLGLGADGDVATPIYPAEGQRLLFYSDGAVEARDNTGRYFDLAASFQGAAQLAPDSLLDRILHELRCHGGGEINDDVILVLLDQPRIETDESVFETARAG